jgi:hypothetical protein
VWLPKVMHREPSGLAPGSSEKLGAENAVIRAATRAIFFAIDMASSV